MDDSCEHLKESSGSIKDEEFLEQLIDYQLFKKDFAARDYLLIVPKIGQPKS
jgi:hypothetical protein